MPLSTPAAALAGLRVALGSGSWAAPNLVVRAFGVSPAENPNSPFLMRLFGVRDAVLGAGVLATSGAERQRWLQFGVAIDLVDAAGAALSGRQGSLSKGTTIASVVTALTAAGLGIVALMQDE